MSLINRMLQELDARSSGSVGGAIHEQVKVVSKPRKSGRVVVLLALGFAVLLGVGISWFLFAPPDLKPQRIFGRIAKHSGTHSGVVSQAPAVASIPPAPPAPSPPPVPSEPPAPAASGLPPPSSVQHVPLPPLLNSPSVKSLPDVPVEKDKEEEKDKDKDKNINKNINGDIDRDNKNKEKKPVPSSTKLSAASAPADIKKEIKELTLEQRAENEYRKAISFISQSRGGEAIAALERSLQFDSKHAAARQTLVGLLLENKKRDEAIQILRQGLDLDPAQTGMAMLLARVQLEKNALKEAVEILQGTLPYATERADYHAFLAALLQRQARHKEAIEHYLHALRQPLANPSPTSIWWMGLGISLQAENRLAEAREAFMKAKATNALSADLSSFVEQRLNQLAR